MIIDEQGFDSLVFEISGINGFPLTEELNEAIATVILHAPPDMGNFDQDYIAKRVAKMMANKVAYDKLQEIKAKREETAKAAQAVGVSSEQPAVSDQELPKA